jgi:hypothetical protein
MKNKWTMMAGVAAALIGFSTTAQAILINNYISGTIGFAGDVTLNGSVGIASEVTQWLSSSQTGSPQVGTATGDFATYVTLGDAVTFATTPWLFYTSTPISAFWSVDGFTFDLTSSSITIHTSTEVDVYGTGTVSGNGFAATAGTWFFTAHDPDDTFSFSSTTVVPDGGVTVMLLGAALSALGLFRKKLIV